MAGLTETDGEYGGMIASHGLTMVGIPQMMTDLTAPEFWAPCLLLSLLIFLMGWRLGLSSRRRGDVDGHSSSGSGVEPLIWRHEKLVLSERLQVDRETRIESFGSRMLGLMKDPDKDHSTLRAELALFLLGERFRDERGRVGTELSRWQAVSSVLSSSSPPVKDSFNRLRDLVAGLIHQLELSRDCLREAQLIVGSYEETCVLRPEVLTVESMADLISRLRSPGSPLASLDTVNLTDQFESLRSLFADRQVVEWDPIRKYLLLDGAEATPAPASLRSWLRQLTADLGTPDDRPVPPTGSEIVPLPPESSPQQTPPVAPAAGASADSTSTESASAEGDLLIFCSNRVDLWGQEIYRGSRHRARRLASLPEWAQWLSLTRLDTGDRLFVPTSTASLGSCESETSFGFNGTGETYYGARHLGIFSADCPNEIETRFTYGGWGFGHRSGDVALASENLQASGWAGREIPGDTVFAIVLHAALPDLGPKDTVLGVDS